MDGIEEITQPTNTENKAITVVQKDFGRAKQYLQQFHKNCVDRYKHYVSPGLDSNPNKDKYFPVPFTTEQIDTLVADMMDKLWYKDEPCSVYGRNEADKADADAKREFMKYQDDRDDLHSKCRQAIINCCICKIAPAVVDYKEETIDVDEMQETDLINPDTGMPFMGIDGVTPVKTQESVTVKEFTYQGATVKLIDPIDFFWTPEKRDVYDEHPIMVRQMQTKQWFESRPYIIQENIKKLVNPDYQTLHSAIEDLLDERRTVLGMGKNQPGYEKLYEYIEWHGYFEGELYIIGVAEDKVLLRFETAKEVFDLGHPNIVVGVIGREFGEIYGLSLIDKFHSVQHAMDSLLGMWLRSLRQTVNPMWIGNSNLMITKKLVNDAGFFIETRGNPQETLQRIEQEQISKDIYAGLEMLRKMGQNASGISDIAAGVVQQGVETLGEANILAGQSALRSKGGYLRSFEKTFIEPIWKMRNHINNRFCTDVGYMYSVLEENFINWRTIDPASIRAEVDFVCEASARESQRSVITQQILSAVNLNLKAVEVLGPVPLVKLFEKLYEEGFGWKQSYIKQLLPPEAIEQQVDVWQQLQQAQAGGMTGENPQRMAQPMNESNAIKSASTANQPQVDRLK